MEDVEGLVWQFAGKSSASMCDILGLPLLLRREYRFALVPAAVVVLSRKWTNICQVAEVDIMQHDSKLLSGVFVTHNL
jgi:hypothetical protein